MIDRRGFIKISATTGAAVAFGSLIGACRDTDAPRVGWEPESIAGLEVHFDATQLLHPMLVCDEFRRPDSQALGICSGGQTWSQNGDLALTMDGVAMASGSSPPQSCRQESKRKSQS